jgi:hypothetical protein
MPYYRSMLTCAILRITFIIRESGQTEAMPPYASPPPSASPLRVRWRWSRCNASGPTRTGARSGDTPPAGVKAERMATGVAPADPPRCATWRPRTPRSKAHAAADQDEAKVNKDRADQIWRARSASRRPGESSRCARTPASIATTKGRRCTSSRRRERHRAEPEVMRDLGCTPAISLDLSNSVRTRWHRYFAFSRLVWLTCRLRLPGWRVGVEHLTPAALRSFLERRHAHPAAAARSPAHLVQRVAPASAGVPTYAGSLPVSAKDGGSASAG